MKNKNIVLIGMPGCGKSTIGKKLSKRLGLNFVDVDKHIEKTQGKTIKEIFENSGEEYFRNIETEAVKELSMKKAMIISTGGGVIKSSTNIEYLKNNGIIIFIDRPVEQIISDVDMTSRPLLKDGAQKIYKLYDERYNLYKKYCDYAVVNDKDLNEVQEEIIKLLEYSNS